MFIEKFNNIEKFLGNYQFFLDIILPPDEFDHKNSKICSICLDHCNFPVKTSCGHTYCWKCLFDVNKTFNFCPFCKTETNVDPVLIILNTLIDCDKKYSPLRKKKITKIDIVSDLHIDQWSTNYKNKYPCGEVKNFPLKFENVQSQYLIVAGDVCDNLNESIKYLNEISIHYEKILFVDGNHEHVHKYPYLYQKKYIKNLIDNDKIIYLSNEPYLIKNTLFIGCCGWWDYNNKKKESIDKSMNYFNQWIPEFSKEDHTKFINNVVNKANEEYKYLVSMLNKYQNDENVKDIIIVTHTLPDVKFCENHSLTDNSATQFNTKMNHLLKYKKIIKWIFGHTHRDWEETYQGIHFICNPRGRPEDYNREKYNMKQIEIIDY